MAVISEEAFIEHLAKLGLGEGSDLEPLWKRMMVAMSAETKRRFQTSTAPDGTSWPKLKIRKGKPLWDSANLMLSCTQSGHPDAIRKTSRLGFEFGTSVSYANTHNDGAMIKPKQGRYLTIPIKSSKGTRFIMLEEAVIPKREFLGFNEQLISTFCDLATDYAAELVDR